MGGCEQDAEVNSLFIYKSANGGNFSADECLWSVWTDDGQIRFPLAGLFGPSPKVTLHFGKSNCG